MYLDLLIVNDLIFKYSLTPVLWLSVLEKFDFREQFSKHRTLLWGRLMLRDPGLREPGLREIPLLETYYRDTDCINTSLIEKTNCHLKPNADEIVFIVGSLSKCLQ